MGPIEVLVLSSPIYIAYFDNQNKLNTLLNFF